MEVANFAYVTNQRRNEIANISVGKKNNMQTVAAEWKDDIGGTVVNHHLVKPYSIQSTTMCATAN